MSKKISSRNLAILALVSNAVLWGLAFPIVKKGYQFGLTPYAFLTGRMFIALLFSLPILYLIRKDKGFKLAFKPLHLFKVIPLELLGTTITLLLLYEGLRLTSAIESTLITMTTPLFVVVGGIFFLKEKEEAHEWFGLILALLGTLLLVVNPLLKNLNGTGSLVGNLFILGQNLTLTLYYLLAKRLYRPLNKFAVTHLSFWVGSLTFPLVGTYLGHSPLTEFLTLLSNLSFWPLLAIFYMAIPGSILGLTLYLIGQDKIEASEATLFSYLQPVIAIPASIILIGESINPIEILATLLIILGVYLSQWR